MKWSLWHYNQSVISVWFLKQDALISMTISMLHRHSKLKYLKIKGWVQKILGQNEIQTEYSVIIVLGEGLQHDRESRRLIKKKFSLQP